ncbi:MAG: RDD family protein [unclassified Hahellaceae]|nr:RDD family protein [Hahellaceae bacterium]|tara:strand:+ start:21919 stop:22368 length:450 start_codon:yes stop_codon:yes gene_type:complete
MHETRYAGFWIRAGAALIDSLLILIVIAPLLTFIYGMGYWRGEAFIYGPADVLISYVAPAVLVILFWIYKSATPGKIWLNLEIVDAETGREPRTSQLIKRYFAYYLSMLPFCLGFFAVGSDRRKQGWHDKLAGTLVVRRNRGEPSRQEV